ncbi:MAG: hypothetical protein AUI11_02420 [Acidobacteria bacterium 13_2_20CM_2_66_4]|nr:MAG: hypothetical protein AUI11_02420 [Acidobacteria bacterium 13_2_20CM_2_66_4]
MPIGVVLTSRSQLPGSGGHAPVSPDATSATCPACARLRAWNWTAQPTDVSATPTARAAPPAPSTEARSPFNAARPLIGCRNPSASVLAPIQRPFSTWIVLMAPIRRATASISSTRSKSDTLCGIVTLAPLTPIARPNVTKSSALVAGNGTYTASVRVSRNAALCIDGDTECATEPATMP